MKKMFFVIRNNGSKSFIVPFYSQSEILDKLFTGDKLADANISQYNTYTKNFLKDNSANSCVYWSDDFTWDASTKTFNFNKLVECLDDVTQQRVLCEFWLFRYDADIHVCEIKLDRICIRECSVVIIKAFDKLVEVECFFRRVPSEVI